MKRVVITGVVCLLAGAAVDRLLVWGAVSQPASTTASSKPAYTMPNNETGQGGNGQASKDRIASSPRHSEMVDIKVPGVEKPMKAFVVHPERADKAPVVLCIMEIFGMSDWVKATTDQLAADGFIAIAPDFTSLKDPGAAVNSIPAAEVMADLNAARDYGLKLPSANGKSATVGFCWGGGMSFNYAAHQPDLNAAVVFYGPAPADEAMLAKIKAPVAGFYGGNDNRITSAVPAAADRMKKLEKSFVQHTYEGAGHGFMRQQNTEPNARLVVKFLKENTEPKK
jgi:carboxymethylenebutenolidase